MYVPFALFSFGGGASVWTDMPAAKTELYANDLNRKRLDLTAMSQVRFATEVRVVGSAGANLDIQYATNIASPTWTDLNLDISLASLGWATSVWTSLPVGAKDDVLLRVVGQGGNGAADPNLINIGAEFR